MEARRVAAAAEGLGLHPSPVAPARLASRRPPLWSDLLSYAALVLGTLVMFGPVLWVVVSSFKVPSELYRVPATFLPEQWVFSNYTDALRQFPFVRYLANSVFVTLAATAVTLAINSMAAFALSKYRFPGRDFLFLFMLSTLMVPLQVIMIPIYLVVARLGMIDTLWGIVIPPAATPTGVFLLRQYMLTIPDELLDAARIDGAGEWRIYRQIMLPLTRPALAVLAIFSIMWRWNDYLWPLIVISSDRNFTLQLGLARFQGQLVTDWNYVLAMTVLSILPITLVFAFLQRYLVSGIATTGLKG
ncbi:carbohydrate ABC transporter permease [Carboxydochorda subterranea]|uniref:Carbohydrate ABC transporter permease n=2 Tax=Carboxydichorda subterranea TaxID=3109565 RepID=A0ABZ1BZX7_9FIRM|nr:carbohydrate ABC transporter permease [Limnochorda sp. L945t]WRP17608.1 carbohydrate ABC transporter permease [Limnochorda sp. L945t]